MKINRLSLNILNTKFTPYERKRAEIMGAHLERLFFTQGFGEFNIPNCDFVYIAITSDPSYDILRIPKKDDLVKEANIGAYIEYETFFSLKATDRLHYLFEVCYGALYKFASNYRLDIHVLEKMYSNIINQEFFLPYFDKKKGICPHEKKIQLMLKYIWLYDLDYYVLDVIENETLIQRYNLCEVTPVYLPAEHPNEPYEKIIRYPEIIGWVDNDFIIKFGYKEYVFSKRDMKIGINENESIKLNYINWNTIN
jgi:hypothetical protein